MKLKFNLNVEIAKEKIAVMVADGAENATNWFKNKLKKKKILKCLVLLDTSKFLLYLLHHKMAKKSRLLFSQNLWYIK